MLAHDEAEECRLARAVLPHERDLHALLQGEVSLGKDGMIMPVIEGYFLKADDCFARAGTGRAVRIRCHISYIIPYFLDFATF